MNVEDFVSVKEDLGKLKTVLTQEVNNTHGLMKEIARTVGRKTLVLESDQGRLKQELISNKKNFKDKASKFQITHIRYTEWICSVLSWVKACSITAVLVYLPTLTVVAFADSVAIFVSLC